MDLNEMKLTRRTFLGGTAAWTILPNNLTAAPNNKTKKPDKNLGTAIWEKPDGSATDSVMVRRLYLDLAGRIPTREEAQAYVYSANPNKLESLMESLLASKDFTDYWTMRFCDVLRVKSEFPINLWPNAVYVYHARIRRFVEQDESWDDFGRALLTSQGSNFRDAEVNFFRATNRRDPNGWAEATAQTFLGIPPSELTASQRANLSVFFANVKIKNSREWKEEIVYVDGDDLRDRLCERLFADKRREVSAAFLKLVHGWIFGTCGTPRKNSEELHLKNMLRKIVMSKEYSQGSISGGFPVRQLDAEVLDDIFCSLGGDTRNYQSPAPEPFTFLPPDRRTICVEDGSITNGFLTLFGRPARDTGLPDERGTEVTAKQRLYLFNSGKLHQQLNRIVASSENHNNAGNPTSSNRTPFPKRVDDIYWKLLSREPSPRERQLIVNVWQKSKATKTKRANPPNLLRDVAWCLINTKEFLFRI